MIRSLSGTVLDISDNVIVIEAGGIGFEVTCTRSALKGLVKGKKSRIITSLQFYSNGAAVYGFGSELELAYFTKIIAARGIGSKLAVAILSELPLSEIYRAVKERKPDVLCRVPGLGKKKAERLCLELKDLPAVKNSTKFERNSLHDMVDALLGMGFSHDDVMNAMELVRAAKGDDFDSLSEEDMLRLMLRELNRK